MDTQKSVSRSSFAFLSGTLLSRVTGLIRDISMAAAFGSNPAIAAFMVAFRLSNLIRRLLGEGPIASGFIPHFEHLRGTSPDLGSKFARDLLFSLGLLLIFIVGASEVLLWGVCKWGRLSPDNAQVLTLTMWMMPGVLFICLFGLSSALLQCERKFFLTGFAPVAFNAVWIAAAFWLKGTSAEIAVLPLSIAIVFAYLMQWLMLAPQTFSLIKHPLSWKDAFKPQIFSPEIRKIVRPLILGIIGTGAVQINSALDAIFARYASLEGPAYLWYAIRIEQLPLALFGVAMSAALLPPLSRAIKEGVYDHYLRLLRFAFRRTFSLIFPCMLGLFVLGLAGINLLYGRGDFTGHDTYQTALCLWGYGFGLLPSVFVLLLAPGLYAQKEYRIPMKGSIYSVILNVLLTALFVFGFGWGAFSISIATSAAAWYNYFYLSSHLSKKIGEPLLNASVYVAFLKVGSSAVIAAVATLFVGQYLAGDPTLSFFDGTGELTLVRDFWVQAKQFLALSGTFVLMFFAYARMMNAEDVLELVGIKKPPV